MIPVPSHPLNLPAPAAPIAADRAAAAAPAPAPCCCSTCSAEIVVKRWTPDSYPGRFMELQKTMDRWLKELLEQRQVRGVGGGWGGCKYQPKLNQTKRN